MSLLLRNSNTPLQWPQSTKFSLLCIPFFSNKWCREENKWCREENKWCREENKWCREEKVYFGATVLPVIFKGHPCRMSL